METNKERRAGKIKNLIAGPVPYKSAVVYEKYWKHDRKRDYEQRDGFGRYVFLTDFILCFCVNRCQHIAKFDVALY